MKKNYSDFGLVNTRDMLAKAYKGGYAVPAYNFNNMEQLQAILIACLESQSPVILQVSQGGWDYATPYVLMNMLGGGIEMMKAMAREKNLKEIPIAVHIDHATTFEFCKDSVDFGFSSVMIDGSHYPYEENVAVTKKVVEYAHQFDISVEGELGFLAGIQDTVSSKDSLYTDPEQVEDFVNRTGVDSLAIAIGTSHGIYKFKVDRVEDIPQLRFDILEDVSRRLPNFPIVLHGASSVPQEAVKIINEHGGNLEKAFGVPEDQLKKASTMAVCKINVDDDCRLWMTAAVRKYLIENPKVFDPRKYLKAAREAAIEMYKHKNDVYGSSNKA